MRKILTASFLAITILLVSYHCVSTDSSYSRVAPGMWRGVLELEKFQMAAGGKDSVVILYDQFKPGELPFNFEVKYVDETHFYLEIMNGSERIRLDSVQYGRDRTQARDTMNVWFPEYASYLHAEIRGGVMRGEWVVTTKENYRIPFYAYSGRGYRFTNLQEKPLRDLSGNWATLFGIEKDASEHEKAIGEFKQNGNHLEGTFRTETGDYRFLEGTVQGRKFWLSCFDGAHAYLFSGSIKGDSLQGEFRSGHKYQTLWTAWLDPSFKLAEADSMTQVKPNAKISFSVKNPAGQELTFPSAQFDNKIKIFTVMGTWCPNCRDEQIFLRDFLKENPEIAKEISVVGFSFERFKDPAQANAHILEYKQKLGIPFEIVYAETSSKEEAAKFFPALDKVMAFPTMMILDKQNQVRRVHTGFDGPATSKYADFKKEFSKLMEDLRD
ncbi:MAG: TlpA family protein disulfide reductase [Lewinellaceae bacterium]|nr:TlpA family protein disulfide reductase [Lewinellaceae bacterium]